MNKTSSFVTLFLTFIAHFRLCVILNIKLTRLITTCIFKQLAFLCTRVL